MSPVANVKLIATSCSRLLQDGLGRRRGEQAQSVANLNPRKTALGRSEDQLDMTTGRVQLLWA